MWVGPSWLRASGGDSGEGSGRLAYDWRRAGPLPPPLTDGSVMSERGNLGQRGAPRGGSSPGYGALKGARSTAPSPLSVILFQWRI